MKFKKGDLVICTGWDYIHKNLENNKNVLEYYGHKKTDIYEIINLYPNYNNYGDDLISFNNGGHQNIGLKEEYFTLLSEYREKEINKLM